MPQGRSEDWLLIEFRNKLMEKNGDKNGEKNGDKDHMWAEFREKVEESIEQRSVSSDMGMDRAI